MTLKRIDKLLVACLVLATAIVASITGHAQIPTPTANWVNIKDPKFGAMGDGSHDDTAAIQGAIDYAFAHGLKAVYCPAGNYKTTSTIYLDPPGNMRASGRAKPTMFAFTMAFFGDPSGGGDAVGYFSCQLHPTFQNDIALLVGTGQGMRVSDMAVIGPSGAYRCNQSSNGIGIGLSGGGGGSLGNLIENTYVANEYALYEVSANGVDALGAHNHWRQPTGQNGCFGFRILGTQIDVHDIIAPNIMSTTVGVDSEYGRPVNVYGGNLSATDAKRISFTISNVSTFTKTPSGNGSDYTFTAKILSPDLYIPNVYNSYMINTAHFGVIPLTMTNWNAGTSTGTFKLWAPWVFANYGTMDLSAGTDVQAEMAAVTTLYAAERVVVAQGTGITLDGVWIENPAACTSLLMLQGVWVTAERTVVKDPYFNADPSNPAGTANVYCTRAFPFIGQGSGVVGGSGNGNVWMSGGLYTSSYPLNIDVGAFPDIQGTQLVRPRFNIRVYDNGGYAYKQLGGYGQFASEGRGAGLWDNNYFIPSAWGSYSPGKVNVLTGELTSPYCGYEPCPWTTPNLSPTIFASVSGALGSYPPIACRTVYKSVDWNTGALAHLFLRSASCPGYSWGQNLTDATVGETVTWSYKGQSNVLYLDAKVLSYMFPGLEISLDNGGGPVTYIITGVYPDLGYVTVMNATNNSGGPLAGTKTNVYSCASGCKIGQTTFAWTAY